MIEENLPLFRSKLPGICNANSTPSNVGPGSYDVTTNYTKPNHGLAPFGSTSVRFSAHRADGFPGVGAYNIDTENTRKGEITIVPFASTVDRFFGPRDDVPGPGEYPHDGNRWGYTGRSYTMESSPRGSRESAVTGGPGLYNPNYSAAHRSHPKTANFGGYSGRMPPRYNDVPGPGSYEGTKDNSIYSRKPTSMFATKTPRTMLGADSKTPGPGAYNLPSSFQSLAQYRVANPEEFSAFGSSAKRGNIYQDNDWPGPGAYTGNIAPRRPQQQYTGKGTSSFVSGLNRYAQPAGTNLGPGAYESPGPTKQQRYERASVPFRSSVGRFPSVKLAAADKVLETRHPVVRVPHRIHPARSHAQMFDGTRSFKPLKTLPGSTYNVKHDWEKPKCTSGAYLGTAPRFTETNPTLGFPGPAHYNLHDERDLSGGRPSNSSWGTDGRFKKGPEGTPGPGHYWQDSTTLQKSFNRTLCS